MRPARLRARNFRTFHELDLEFGDGLVGILGELRDAPEGADSNGAGKSTILEAIDIALFGRRSLAGFLTRGGDVDELVIELTFEHAGELYRVRRTYSAKGRGKTSVDLEHRQGPDWEDLTGWIPLTCASAKETDALIVGTLGLSRDTYRNSCYLRQGDGSFADPDRDARQRKELLVEAVLGRDPVWPKLADLAKIRRKSAQTQLERIAGQSERDRSLATELPEVETAGRLAAAEVEAATAAVAAGEQEVERLQESYRAARETAAARQAREAELQTARADLDRLQRLDVAATEAATAIAATRDELETFPTSDQTADLEAALATLETRQAEYRDRQNALAEAQRERDRCDQLRTEAAQLAVDLRTQAEQLRRQAAAKRADDQATCQTCGQHIADAAKERAIAELERVAAECDAKAVENDAAVERLTVLVTDGDEVLAQAASHPIEAPAEEAFEQARSRLAAARSAATQRARLEERTVQLQRDVDARPAQETIAAAHELTLSLGKQVDELEPVDLAAIEAHGRGARTVLDGLRQDLAEAIAAKARIDEKLAQIEASQERLYDASQATKLLQGDIDRDVLLERVYGRDGIPALIIENSALPYLETEATRILGLLGTSFQVELRTQAENKTGGLRDTLDVIVIDPDGNEADFADGCSGGEQTRIGLALRIALARLLAHRRGAVSRLLALDEPSYLDQAGMTALLEVLRGLEDEFDVILLVSHVAELRDALDQAITVVKTGGRSRIARAAVAEEVPA